MTISIDWAGTRVISVPKADLTLIDAGPPEVYELDIDAFRLTLRDLEDDPDGRPWPQTHRHNTEVILAGVTYARMVEILSPYTVTFEDGQYAVQFTGANTNVHEVTNVNQVSVRPNNSAGLITVVQGSGVTEQDKIDIATKVWDDADAQGLLDAYPKILGLSNKNVRHFNRVYNAHHKLTSVTVKTYANKSDCDSDQNALQALVLMAEYDPMKHDEMTSFKVTDQ